MKTIHITKEGVIEYYGNRAGFVRNHTATVDEMFRKDDLIHFLGEQKNLSVKWKNGVYDMLVKGVIEDSVTLKMCRVYQLKPNVDMRMKFIGYEELQKRGFGKPSLNNYQVVYDGNIGTNDLEEIYSIFSQPDKLPEFTGYALSVSDIIELYDENESEFQYVDKWGFVKLEPNARISENKAISEDKTEIREKEREESRIVRCAPPNAQNEQHEPDDDLNDDFHVETFKITM